jgi:predicted nucleic acid-binding protein
MVFVRETPSGTADHGRGWALAYKLSEGTHGEGATIPATDILIAACAQFHGVELEHSDSDFERLK